MICTIADCGKDVRARGLCRRHYGSFMKYGDPLASRPRYQAFTDTEKTCPDCGETKPLDQFSPNSATRSGKSTYCHPYQSTRARASHRRRTPEQVAAARAKRRRRTLEEGYGMTLEEFDELLDSQGGVCICGATRPGGQWQTFHVDHDHQTGAVRGLLCHGCNTALGLAGEDAGRLRLLAAYLERHA